MVMNGKKGLLEPEPYILPDTVMQKVHEAMQENVTSLVELFRVLSDPVRIHILKALEIQELCVCVLVETTDYKHSALSYHLKLLKEAGLVESTRNKNFQMYSLTDLGRSLLKVIDKTFHQ